MAELNYYEKQEIDATARVAALLKLPPITADGCYSDGDCLDPWSLFPSLYGSYSSEFDDMAIEVLTDIRDNKVMRSDLAAEMFREMLCTSGLCDYGTSPRVCFASSGFRDLLPALIERWKEYAAIKWQTN